MTTLITSRVGRKPITIPSGVEVRIQGQKISAKGPRGQLELDLHPFAQVKTENNHVHLSFADGEMKNVTGTNKKLHRSIMGTARARINNIIQGVHHGYERKLLLVGVGYRAQAKGKVLSLSLGYSHPTDYALPTGITVETPTPTEIIVKGTDKALVGQVAVEIRRYRSPEPYKGKGVRYANEVIELKETKKK